MYSCTTVFYLVLFLFRFQSCRRQTRIGRYTSGQSPSNKPVLVASYSRAPSSPSSPFRQRNIPNQGNMTKESKGKYNLGHARPALLSLSNPSSSTALNAAMHPTLVSHTNSKTASAALSSHSSLTEGTEGTLGRYHLQAHSLRLWFPRSVSRKEVVARLPPAAVAAGTRWSRSCVFSRGGKSLSPRAPIGAGSCGRQGAFSFCEGAFVKGSTPQGACIVVRGGHCWLSTRRT